MEGSLILQRSLGCTTAHIPATISTEPHKLLVEVQEQGEELVKSQWGKEINTSNRVKVALEKQKFVQFSPVNKNNNNNN